MTITCPVKYAMLVLFSCFVSDSDFLFLLLTKEELLNSLSSVAEIVCVLLT